MNRIRELREEKKITQLRLSMELEVSQETVSAYEVEKYHPSVKTLIKLRDIFGESIDYILGLSDTRYESVQMSRLKEEELAVIHMYRRLDSAGREAMVAYMTAYLTAMKKRKEGETST